MSRREDRSLEPKRYCSRSDREPSPKRSRRDGKPKTERPSFELDLGKYQTDRDPRHHRRLQDPLPLESGTMSKESEKGADGHKVAVKSSDPTKIPLSRSYFQHNDRASTGQNGRGFSRRTDSERGWCGDSRKQQRNERSINRTVSVDALQRDERFKDNRESNHVWRHDGYFGMEAPVRKRPAFREQKIPGNPDRTNKAADDHLLPTPHDLAVDSGRRNERGYNYRNSDRPERPVAWERELNRAQSWRGNFPSGDRWNAHNRYRGRDRFPANQGYHPTGGRVEKWKHDLYDEANRSPPPKNEEDQISKIEALLTS